MPDDKTESIEAAIQRLNNGDPNARDELIRVMMDRFRSTASRLLRRNPKVRRWEMTDDVMQETMLRLYRSLEDAQPATPRELFGLARLQITRELTDLARKHYGPMGIGQNHATDYALTDNKRGLKQDRGDDTHEPGRLSEWLEFHQAIEKLDEPLKEVFQMSWYKLMTHTEMAQFLNCSTKTIQRRFREACLQIQQHCQSMPGEA